VSDFILEPIDDPESDECHHSVSFDEECEECADEDEDGEEWEEWCPTCNNLGTVLCECGGDLCICLNNGEMPCPDCQ
jgi:hypothetical protein